MKKYIPIFILFIFSIFFLAGCSDEERFFTIDNVTINAFIQEDGTIHVEEYFSYTFHGSYEGMTRAIESDVHGFEAFITDESGRTIEPLETEEEDGTYKIYSDSTDEKKNVSYQYAIEGSVKKYTDVADLRYAFFDESNETDLHQVEISIHPPENNMSNTHYFLHEDETGKLSSNGQSLVYNNSLLESGEQSLIRFVFPAEQLPNMEMSSEKMMEDVILANEAELVERKASLNENMEKIVPIIIILIGVVSITTILMLIFHPFRYRGDKSVDALIRLLEKTDPLFVKYLFGQGYLSEESFIAALFSLKQRGVVKLQKVPSEVTKDKNTFRFTWVKDEAEVDAADQYLRTWLFTESDDAGDYFLLESVLDHKSESDEVKKEKAEHFQSHFSKWTELVKKREGFQESRKPFKAYSFLSIPILLASFGLYYYFTTIDTISATEQWVLPLITGVITIIALVFNRNKWVLYAYYFMIIIMTAIGFSFTPAIIWTLVFYGISFIALLSVPARYWNKETRKLKFAIKTANKLLKNDRYPVDANEEKIERRLEYAIVLGNSEAYAKRCGKEVDAMNWEANLPLLANPAFATAAFNSTDFSLYTATLSSSSNTTNTTSSTGGGGAGAF
ncbi:DUF2207 domain-containing protein [Oceanobacillus halophilus]|uniref:DUF2207 domain-containing protein n=1 Tax=Oceanobacillus halophilus TaxID=930130 RepID=UPI001314FFBF|nr:DUF2207 domain-containing protein [Oceanobacillus halophilus]